MSEFSCAPRAASFAARWGGGYANAAVPRRADPPRLQSLAGRTMGTTWSLRFDNPAMLARDAVHGAVAAALDRVIAQMSTWEAGSDIGRYNRAAAGTRHVLPGEFADVLGCALHWARASAGAFDPTVGPLVAAWGFGAAQSVSPVPPDEAALAAARARVGWRRLDFDPAARSVVQPGGVALDLSGIAKGFAVDHVADALTALGLHDFLIEIGGELRAAGRRPDGDPWRVRIDDAAPAAASSSAGHRPTVVALTGLAVATSGDRWHAHAHAGRRWAHTIDPRTGAPADDAVASVTVLHARCMHADALATTLTVLGPLDGPAFAQRHGIAALFLLREGMHASAAWHALAAA